MRTVKAVFSCSLALVVALAGAQDYADAVRRLDAARQPGAAHRVVEAMQSEWREDETLAQAADAYLETPTPAHLTELRDALELRALAQGPEIDAAKAVSSAKAVKSGGLYADPGLKQQSNWFARLIERLKNLRSPDLPEPTGFNVPGVGGWIITVVKVLLIGAVLLFLVLAARHFGWKRRLKRRSSALLDEDEPERTPDEWLGRAEELARAGRHREAVRCLYLACLLRFDEHGVARFMRHETNWEHLRRIEASPKLPSNIEFREPTRSFDRIWYGNHVRGVEDYDQFNVWYRLILSSLEEKAA